ncbi:MAG: succinate dehydrogenase hydrophobic membrane anchor subunit [Candidatus Nanopelagicales bacterium]|jgi:succinate dehydrogenase / fumarate reductase, membrane anchor subunit|nr:succinate dehydrogenase hydrophobic membrane anchor subunit [Candidatus Nanopelagicales bacterium]MCF8538156.1 succinate dehydrogenase hydrophobic membrane anchor subunit [Candidatus Nanopelagicales bacterium]MCF8543624.1 succinate dehydrogenase hydrophobic membrane anchor subunit [Candidatus Nanopelagicales bacterium]MCF8556007.1 succinate dehydrogenase hydrophobic membrane anchor subunit [Candidatus Nanopelagicales bacterium]
MSTTSQPESISIAAPRSSNRTGQRSNFELYSWLFMRISGIVLIFLVLGHLFIMNILDGGVQRINFAFVAGRWSSPFWQVWDLLMLWLAMIHGTNGMRTIINDYAERDQTRFWLKMLLFTAAGFTIILGTLVIFTFDPNIG